MSNPINLLEYKRAKARKEELEPYLKELDKLSDFLYNFLHLRLSFSILEVVEDVRIQYYMELNELNKILNSNQRISKLKKDNK